MMLKLAEEDQINGVRRWSNVDIAKKCNVDEKTVRNVKKLSSEFPKINQQKPDSEFVIVHRGNSTYTQDTGNIGKSKAQASEASKVSSLIVVPKEEQIRIRILI